MLLVPVNTPSTDVLTAGYDPDGLEMQIQFTNNRIYSYANVPPEIYQSFLDAPSKGQWVAMYFRHQPGIYLATRLQ